MYVFNFIIIRTCSKGGRYIELSIRTQIPELNTVDLSKLHVQY